MAKTKKTKVVRTPFPNAMLKEFAKREGKKKQLNAGQCREAIKVMASIIADVGAIGATGEINEESSEAKALNSFFVYASKLVEKKSKKTCMVCLHYNHIG